VKQLLNWLTPVVVVLVLFSVSTSRSDAEPAGYQKVTEKTFFNGEKITEYALPNGLRVLLVPRHQAKVLTYQVWFHVGSNDEKLDPKLKKTGLAHLFEHMMFRGSEKFPEGQFDIITSRLGAERQNATTSSYRTNYFENVPSKFLEKIILLESDRMEHLKLNKEGFEKEKGAVVGELRRHNDVPATAAMNELMTLSYEALPFRYTTIGTEAEIRGFTMEEGEYFYRTFYSPNNATVIVIGDTTEQVLMPLIVKYYGAMKSQKLPVDAMPTEPVQTKERRSTITHPQATTETLLVGYKIPPVTSEDVAPLSLLSDHLSAGMESRFRKVFIDTGIAVRATSDVGSFPDQMQFYVQMAEKHNAGEALKILDREIATLRSKAISKESFERALNQDLLGVYSGIGDNMNLGNWLGEYLTMCGNYMRGFELVAQYKSQTPAELLRVAKKYLVKESRSVVIVKPGPKGKS
jgi:zinc protease